MLTATTRRHLPQAHVLFSDWTL
jgi:hypothetical protein